MNTTPNSSNSSAGADAPAPTGRIVPTEAGGHDLVLERSFSGSVEDVWASITEPERTARWFASWTGEPGVGRTIRYRMTHEGDDAPEGDMTIDACDPPHHLALSAVDEHGSWLLEATLRAEGGRTVLTFVQHLDDASTPGDTGPGWEYYLDMLVATHVGSPLPEWDDYYPAQKEYYDRQT